MSTSIRVGCGTPKQAGSRSFRSMYSLRQILFVSFLGIGGQWGPIDTAGLGSSLDGFERKDASGDCKDSNGLASELVVTVLAVPEDAPAAIVDNAITDTAVDDPEKVTMPDNAVVA